MTLFQGFPDNWLSSLLVGVLKRHKDKRLPENYRVIGLESCLLKGLTWLIDRRIRRWAEERKLLPWCQNGFRPGFRTNNNSFVLLSAIHTAKALNRPLIVILVDLKNAFPSVNQSILWRKLWDLGIRGPIFDIVRAIYRNMQYVVRLRDELSEPLASNIGILAGDPGSPLFWILYALESQQCCMPMMSLPCRMASRLFSVTSMIWYNGAERTASWCAHRSHRV